MPGAWSSGKRLLWFSTQLIHISNERKDLVRLSVPLQKHVSSFFPTECGKHSIWTQCSITFYKLTEI